MLQMRQPGSLDLVHQRLAAARPLAQGHRTCLRIAHSEHGVAIGVLHREQSCLGACIIGKIGITIEMVGRDVEQGRDVARQRLRDIDLVARQFEHVDPVRGQRILAEDRLADIAPHQARHARLFEQVVDQRGGGRLAVGPGNPDDAVRRKLVAHLRKQLDIADQRDVRALGRGDDRMAVERHAGRDDHAVEPLEVDHERIGERDPVGHLLARFLTAVPGGHLGPAVDQHLHGRATRARKPEHGVALACEGAIRLHRSFSVDRPISARTMATIQKRITTVLSLQPICS